MRRMLLPIIKKYWKLLLSAMLVSSLGCGIMIGMSGAYLSLDRSLDGYVSSYRYPSAIITTDVTSRKKAVDLLSLGGVSAVNTRLCGDTVMIGGNRHLSVRAFSYNDDDLQKFHIWQSADCGDMESVMLEYNFAVDNGIKPGDTVQFHIGEEYRSYAVSAIVSAPETLSVQATEDSWGVNTDFGYAYFSVNLLQKESKKEYDSAKSKLDDQESDLDKAKIDADNSFNEIKNGLNDALKQLEEKNALFANAEKEAGDQKKLLNDKADDLRKTRKSLEGNLSDLANAEKQLNSANTKLPDAIAQLESGISQADSAIEKLLEAKSALDEIDSNIAALNAKLARLKTSDNAAALNILRTMPQDMLLDDLFMADERLGDFITLAAANGYEVDESMKIGRVVPIMALFVETVENDYAFLGNEYNTALIDRARSGENISGEPGYITLSIVIARYDSTLQNGGDVVTAYDRAYARVSLLHDKIQENNLVQTIEILKRLNQNMTLRDLRANTAKLKRLVNELRAEGVDVNTIGDVVNAYDSSISQLESAIAQLNTQRAAIVAELKKQGVNEKDIDKKVRELRTQRNEAQTNLKKAQKQLDDVKTQLAAVPDAREQLKSGISKVDDGLDELAAALVKIDNELDTARKQLAEAQKEYDAGEAEYEKSLADAMNEFAQLRGELEKAYAQLDETEGYDALCNQFMLYFDSALDQAQLLNAAVAALGDDITVKKALSMRIHP